MAELKGFKEIQTFSVSLISGISKAGWLLWKILTFSFSDINAFWKNNICVSISIGSFSIAYGSIFLSRIRIKDVKVFPFENSRYPEPESFAANVLSSMHELKANKTDLTLSIPKEWVIIQSAEFPLAVKSDISNAVLYELDRLTPICPENALYDFKILKEENGKIYILLFVAKKDPVNRYIEVLKAKDIHVNRVTINLAGISSLLSYMDKKCPDTIFVEINKNGYEGGLIADGSVISGFTGSIGQKDNQEYADDIVKEIDMLIDYHNCRKTPLRLIADLKDKIVMIPDQKLSIPVLNLSQMDINLKHTIKSRADIKNLPFMSIGGMLESLWLKNSKPDLLCKGVHKESKLVFAPTVILFVLIIIMGILSYVMPFKIEKQRVFEIDRQIMQIKDEVAKVEKLKKEVDLLASEIAAINNFKQSNHMRLLIVKELTSIIPQNAWLTRLKINGSTAEIEGYADTATEILPKLEASAYFNKAEFASATRRNLKTNADRFLIKMEINGIENFKKEALNSNAQK